jgi:hypothetical protein
MSDNVVEVQPKQRRVQHKRHTVTITYEPATKRWYWEFEYFVRRTLHGWADTITRAEKDAKKWVDEVTSKSSTV